MIFQRKTVILPLSVVSIAQSECIRSILVRVTNINTSELFRKSKSVRMCFYYISVTRICCTSDQTAANIENIRLQ